MKALYPIPNRFALPGNVIYNKGIVSRFRALSFSLFLAVSLSANAAENSSPKLRSVVPYSGLPQGGTEVVIYGRNFKKGIEVSVGGARCLNTQFIDSTRISCVTPPHSAGPADLVAVNPDRSSDTWLAGFVYEDVFTIGRPKGVTIGGVLQLSVSRAFPPVKFELVHGPGSIDATTGLYQAPPQIGSALVRATDGAGRVSETVVTTYMPLSIIPSQKTMAGGNEFRFSAQGGAPPYTFSVSLDGGTIDPSTGKYIAATKPSLATIRVTDAVGNYSDSKITIIPELKLEPAKKLQVDIGTKVGFKANGGLPPYQFSIVGTAGTIDSENGAYEAPMRTANEIVRVTDSLGNATETQIEIKPSSLRFDPLPASAVNNRSQLSAAGGVPPYRFTLLSGLGSIDPSGVYSAPDTTGRSVVRVTDAESRYVDMAMLINPPFELPYRMKTIATREAWTIPVIGGAAPFEFTLTSGRGWVNPTTGTFLAPDRATVATIRVKDHDGASGEIQITVIAGKTITRKLAAGYGHSCAVVRDQVECWGDNSYGQLGDGTQIARHKPVQAKTRNGAVSVSVGAQHSCALIDWGVYCWGDNTYGQLGVPNLAKTGIPVSIPGFDRGVTALATGHFHTCANRGGATYCWGRNDYGQLGVSPQKKPFSKTPVEVLSYGAASIAAGRGHTCVAMDRGAKCWGQNSSGQLGTGDFKDRLTPTAVKDLTNEVYAIEAGGYHTCALMNGGVKCWGYNGMGSLGASGNGNINVPTDVPGIQGSVSSISAGLYHNCALTDGTLRCWGYNKHGQVGTAASRLRMPANKVPNLDSSVEAVAAGFDHTCAVTAEGVACWGSNSHGQSGQRGPVDRPSPTYLIHSR